MHILVVNRSTLPPQALTRALAAVEKQVAEHVARYWDVTVRFRIGPDDHASPVLFVFDATPPDAMPGTGGSHSALGVRPVGWIAVSKYTADHPWTVGLSHEVLEMLVNPQATRLVPGFDPGAPTTRANVVQEICDPVWKWTYAVDGVQVSAFVLPSWFVPSTPKDVVTAFAGIESITPTAGQPIRPGGMVMIQTVGTGVRFVPPDLGATPAAPNLGGLFESGRHRRWAAGGV